MKTVVICPDQRPEARMLGRLSPLALLPVLGRSLLARWLAHLSDSGSREIIILASDRPDSIRTAVGAGEEWGLRIQVLSEPAELSPDAARTRFGVDQAVLLDHLPGHPQLRLFHHPSAFFDALTQIAPHYHSQRIGSRETSPGIWVGLHSRIASSAQLLAPCWIGQNVWIGSDAVVGPNAYVEDSAMIDTEAEVIGSWVGPNTYVGSFTSVNRSLAWADALLNRESGSFTEIIDPFLLSDLRGQSGFNRKSSILGRIAALAFLILTFPIPLVAALKSLGSRQPFLARSRAVVPSTITTSGLRESSYLELNGFQGLARRWPQLWKIVVGEFTWVGNRPITREQAATLETEFEQLWLSAPIGLISLADAHGCIDPFDDEARAHSSFYASRRSRAVDRAILRWAILRIPPTP